VSKAQNSFLSDIDRRKRRKRWLINGLGLFGGVALFSLLGFVGHRQSATKCWRIEVNVEDAEGKYFVDSASVVNALLAEDPSIIGKEVSKINLNRLHHQLTEDPAIREAYVVVTVDGRLVVNVRQRQPFARVITTSGKQFYIDREGFTMPLSDYYTAKVPVFTGQLEEQLQEKSILELTNDSAWAYTTHLDEIYLFTRVIEGNEFWSAMVEHVHFGADGKMSIIPRVGNHRLVIGSVDQLELKLRKLMTFYANTLHQRDLNAYAEIHAEYDGQIVCVKR
jgi:cell division protein FtsQ